jgi:nicotinamidase-related amidase
VHRAADGLLRRGYGVSIVEDAVESLDEKKGREILGELQSKGARLITTEQALTLIGRDAGDGSPSPIVQTAGN